MLEFIKIVKLELFKIFSKWRTYIGFIAIGVLVPLVHTAMYLEGNSYIELVTQTLRNTFNLNGHLLNGYMITQIVLTSLIAQVPLLISIVTGDLLAGEATSGTYRLILSRPVSRLKIVSAKYLAALIYTAAMISWLAFLSLGLGVWIFGTGDLIVVRSSITFIAANDVMWRYMIAFAYAYLSMSVVATISFTFSAFVENSIGPIMSTMALIIVFSIIGILDVNVFHAIKPYLFTTHMTAWRLLFDSPVDIEAIKSAAYVLLAHIVVLSSFTFWTFNRKDVLS